jgi:hypothetical protein
MVQETYCQQKLRADGDCQQFDGAVDHSTSACAVWATERYIQRPELHCSMCKERGVKLDNEHWYEPLSVQVGRSNCGKVTI